MTDLDRRQLLAGVGAAGAAAALAGCGGGGSESNDPSGAAPTVRATSAALAQVDDIAVGTSISVRAADGRKLVVGRPTADTVVAFSARCPHQGCTVAPSGSAFVCPCHDSSFDGATGAVKEGPSRQPLTKVEVTVSGGSVLLA
ncbi:MAG TPA: Rieske (2Fe-2S) protein [Mycobacteriales bacterium]|nr:Rieske (2Fe-2S) protein [Mycobacteriales bacterium]